MDYLANIKALLMLPDSAKDDLINVIIDNTKRALRVRLGLSASDAVPEELSYIVVEVSVRRYNRLKNEGMVSYSQEGESIAFNSNDFADFEEDIKAWKDKNNKANEVRFINPYARALSNRYSSRANGRLLNDFSN